MNWTKRIADRPWYGFLTLETAEGIALAIEKILTGKVFAVASCSDFNAYHCPLIELRTGLQLHNEWLEQGKGGVVRWEANDVASIAFSDGGSLHIHVNTRHTVEPAGSFRQVDGCPYYNLRHDGFTVRQWQEERLMQWKFQVEGDLPFDPYTNDLTLEQLLAKQKETEETLAEIQKAIMKRNAP